MYDTSVACLPSGRCHSLVLSGPDHHKLSNAFLHRNYAHKRNAEQEPLNHESYTCIKNQLSSYPATKSTGYLYCRALITTKKVLHSCKVIFAHKRNAEQEPLNHESYTCIKNRLSSYPDNWLPGHPATRPPSYPATQQQLLLNHYLPQKKFHVRIINADTRTLCRN